MHVPYRPHLIATAAVSVALLGACGSSSSGAGSAAPTTAALTPATATAPATAAPTTTPDAPTTVAAGASPTVQLADSSLGKVLTDGKGMTLYLFTKDTPTTSACEAGCADAWPALVDAAAPTLGAGLSAEDFATITRTDGSKQVTFYGHPLYTYASDAAPGDTTGEGVGKVWFAVDGEGNPIKG